MKISLLTSGHFPFDDRLFFHMGKTLTANGYEVEISSSKISLVKISENISINSFEGDLLPKKVKIETFTRCLNSFNPDIVICSEPLPLLAAWKYKRNHYIKATLIYDITEWYPSRKNLSELKGFNKWIAFIKLLLFNIYASSLCDAFIFGEWYKSRPYRLLFPFRPFCFVPYYPDLNYIPPNESSLSPSCLRLSYSGKISLEKGFGNYINVMNELAKSNPEIKINVKIIGWYGSESDRSDCEQYMKPNYSNISYSVTGRLDFYSYLQRIRDTDIFIDLREDNLENQFCLPIRLFYYAAMGRPVIFSDLKAIRREIEVREFGFLIDPGHIGEATNIILEYIRNKKLYYQHCRNARLIAEESCNWQKVVIDLLHFIDKLSRK